LKIYNRQGKLIKSLSNEQKWATGSYLLIRDGTDNRDHLIVSGINIQSGTLYSVKSLFVY